MNLKHTFYTLILAGILLSLALCGCSNPASASAAPEQVVDAFYRWHLGYPGNPLVDRAYRDSEYLSPTFVDQVDGLLSSFDKGGFDPFLLAQDLPEEITVEDAVIEDGTATVVTHQRYAGNPDVRDVIVELVVIGDQWKINEVAMTGPSPEVVALAAQARLDLAEQLGVDPKEIDVEPIGEGYLVKLSPRGVVQAFYSWYFEYIGERWTDEMRNPLSDRAYRESEWLTGRFVQQIDELLASFNGAGYDPFLCAQDIPQSLSAEELMLDGDTAEVEVVTSFIGHSFRVDLINQDGAWKIDNIRCAFDSAD